MQPIAPTIDGIMAVVMERYKDHLLSQEFTPERSRIVDQIDYLQDAQRDGVPFAEAVRQLQ